MPKFLKVVFYLHYSTISSSPINPHHQTPQLQTMLMIKRLSRLIKTQSWPIYICKLIFLHHQNCYTKWKFKVSQSKSIHITFILGQAPSSNVLLYGIPIPSSLTVKYLGLTLDRHLIWAQHLCKKRLSLNNRLCMLKHFIVIKSPLLISNSSCTKPY